MKTSLRNKIMITIMFLALAAAQMSCDIIKGGGIFCDKVGGLPTCEK